MGLQSQSDARHLTSVITLIPKGVKRQQKGPSFEKNQPAASVKRGERRGPTIFLLRCLDDPLITAELITAQIVDLASIIADFGRRKVFEPDQCCRHLLRIGRSRTARQHDFLVGERDLELVVRQHLAIGRLARRRFGVGLC